MHLPFPPLPSAVQSLGDQTENVAHLLGSIHTVLKDKLGFSSSQTGWGQTSNVMFEYFSERLAFVFCVCVREREREREKWLAFLSMCVLYVCEAWSC